MRAPRDCSRQPWRMHCTQHQLKRTRLDGGNKKCPMMNFPAQPCAMSGPTPTCHRACVSPYLARLRVCTFYFDALSLHLCSLLSAIVHKSSPCISLAQIRDTGGDRQGKLRPGDTGAGSQNGTTHRHQDHQVCEKWATVIAEHDSPAMIRTVHAIREKDVRNEYGRR